MEEPVGERLMSDRLSRLRDSRDVRDSRDPPVPNERQAESVPQSGSAVVYGGAGTGEIAPDEAGRNTTVVTEGCVS